MKTLITIIISALFCITSYAETNLSEKDTQVVQFVESNFGKSKESTKEAKKVVIKNTQVWDTLKQSDNKPLVVYVTKLQTVFTTIHQFDMSPIQATASGPTK